MTVQRDHLEAFPWEGSHAAPADRALGLELELIELVRRQDDIADPTDPESIDLGRQIRLVQDELYEVSLQTPMTV